MIEDLGADYRVLGLSRERIRAIAADADPDLRAIRVAFTHEAFGLLVVAYDPCTPMTITPFSC
ncbi:hypothetical protein [Sphaerisporangium sp. NPDC051011]|uniref:hypothetical protein n=1 Tax=Sphaerisporangium sp. NPDC051011 TaxID=3155792 RepID=UPI0033E60170